MQTGEMTGQTAIDSDAMGLHLLSCVSVSKHVFSSRIKMPWEHKFVGPYDRVADVHKQPLPLRDFLQKDDSNKRDVDEVQTFSGETAFKKAGLRLLKSCDEKLWTERLSSERKAAVRK